MSEKHDPNNLTTEQKLMSDLVGVCGDAIAGAITDQFGKNHIGHLLIIAKQGPTTGAFTHSNMAPESVLMLLKKMVAQLEAGEAVLLAE